MINKAYKVQLYPNKTQEKQIIDTIGCCRFIYNQMLEERRDVYERLKDNKEKLYKHSYMTEKELKEEFDFLSIASSRALQQSRRDLENAYQGFFRRVKKGQKVGFPKFKSKHYSNWSYREPQVSNQIRIEGNKLRLLKLGWVKLRGLAENFKGNICSVTVTKSRSGRYYASILVKKGDYDRKKRTGNNTIGIDIGIKTFATASDGSGYKFVKEKVKKIETKTKKLGKKLARQQKGSNRKEKTRKKIARKYEKINNTKRHYYWHLANTLCRENQTIVVEDLSVANMKKNRCLSHSIHTMGWSTFLTLLEQKAKEYGTEIVQTPRFFASSKICSVCGEKNNELRLSEREWVCPVCGAVHNRDINAAINLKQYAIGAQWPNGRGETVRLVEKSFDFSTSRFVEASTEKEA